MDRLRVVVVLEPDALDRARPDGPVDPRAPVVLRARRAPEDQARLLVRELLHPEGTRAREASAPDCGRRAGRTGLAREERRRAHRRILTACTAAAIERCFPLFFFFFPDGVIPFKARLSFVPCGGMAVKFLRKRRKTEKYPFVFAG